MSRTITSARERARRRWLQGLCHVVRARSFVRIQSIGSAASAGPPLGLVKRSCESMRASRPSAISLKTALPSEI